MLQQQQFSHKKKGRNKPNAPITVGIAPTLAIGSYIILCITALKS